MKHLSSLFCLIALIATSSAFAAGGGVVNIGPALMLGNSPLSKSSVTGFGGMADFQFSATNDDSLLLGFSTGAIHWSKDLTSYLQESGTAIPLLASATFQFGRTLGPARGYLGLSVGMSVTPTTTNLYVYSGHTSDTSETKAYFTALLRPGMRFDNFFIEPRIGVLKDQFIFMPVAGMAFEF